MLFRASAYELASAHSLCRLSNSGNTLLAGDLAHVSNGSIGSEALNWLGKVTVLRIRALAVDSAI
jgi:hypothetical protein